MAHGRRARRRRGGRRRRRRPAYQTPPGRRGRGPRRRLRSSTGKRSAGSSQRSGSSDELGVDREPGRERRSPRASVTVAQPVERGPRPLGVDVVGGDRRDAAPVVDAGVEQRAEVVGRGSAAPAGARRAGRISRASGDRPRGTRRAGTAARACIAVPGLGRKFWTITSCTWPWRRCDVGDGLERVDAVGARLADADEDAGGERDGQLAGGLERGQAALGRLVGRAAVAVEVGVERLEHHPLRRRAPARSARQLVGVERAGVGVGEQAGLVEHQPRTWRRGSRPSTS